MTPKYVPGMARQAMQVAMTVGVSTLLVLLAVELLVVVFQAATQLSKQALSFIPKLLVAAATTVLADLWIVMVIASYTRGVLTNTPNYMN